jgi:hypothetical protein
MNEFDKFVINEYIKLLERLPTEEALDQERLRVAWTISQQREVLREQQEMASNRIS